MSDETVNLALPYILPSQAQKHVTHNEALQRLDAVVQLVIAAGLAAPPDASAEGSCYLVASAATGSWAGKSGLLAFRQDGAWIFIQPREGWRAWFGEERALRIFTAGAWADMGLPADGSMRTLGVNATADETNRLAVASAASLFNHDGNGHQIKVNKAAATDTASLLFQSAWSGRAEMGLAGSDAFSIKVSPDGSAWQTGLAISPEGVVSAPNRPLVRASLGPLTLSPADGSQTGFSNLHVAQGGFSLGEAIGGSAGNRLVVPAAGAYLLLLATSIVSSSGHSVSLLANGMTTLVTTTGPATSGALRQSGAGLTVLSSGDQLSLLHSGAAELEFGSGRTEIIALLL